MYQRPVSPNVIDQPARNIQPDESFSISSLLLRYIIAYHYEEYEKLEYVSKEISFEVIGSKAERNLNFFARNDVQPESFTETVNGFIDFCITQNQKMQQEIIQVLPKNKKDVILKSQTKFLVVIDFQEPDEILIYGENDDVQEAVRFVKGKFGDLTASTTSGSSNCKNHKGKEKQEEMRLFAWRMLCQN